jgi:dUTP pyrophosphatase
VKIEVHFRNPEVQALYANAGVKTAGSAGFDLILAEDLVFEKSGQFCLADLGVVIRVPEGFHSFLIPRSGTFKKYHLLQANSIGLVDQDYCGPQDFWRMPLVYLGEERLELQKGLRLCQLVLQKTYFVTEFVPFEPGESSRGGFGSTGV